MFLNHNVPGFKCWVRTEYFYNLESHRGRFENALVIAATSIPGQAIGFTVLTDRGVQFMHMPISALVHDKKAPRLPLDWLQLWDCFSYDFGVIRLQNLGRCKVQLKDRQWYPGEYRFTLDWADADRSRVECNFAEVPEEHKCAHIIALDNGCFAAQPNNRILWENPDFITRPLQGKPKYKSNTHSWHCETGQKWVTSHDTHMFYDTENPRAVKGAPATGRKPARRKD